MTGSWEGVVEENMGELDGGNWEHTWLYVVIIISVYEILNNKEWINKEKF